MKLSPFVLTGLCGFIAAEGHGAVPASNATSLQAAPTGRYLQWTDGTPFFIHADTSWTLPSAYKDEEVTSYTPISQALELRVDELRPGKVTAQWFDPSSGEYLPLDDSLFAQGGTDHVVSSSQKSGRG